MNNTQVHTTQQTKIICITGYSGSGKATMQKIMQKYLPNTYVINRDVTKAWIIENPDEFAERYCIEVTTNYALECFWNAAIKENINSANAYADVAIYQKYLELLTPYLETKYEESLTNVLTYNLPRFVILSWQRLPVCNIWNKADYRILVKPTKWELLVDNLGKRKGDYVVTQANERYLASKDIIENLENITHVVYNNYDYEYEQKVEDLCVEIIKSC